MTSRLASIVSLLAMLLVPAVAAAQPRSPAAALYSRGLAAAKAGQHAEAAALWKKAVARDPKHVDAFYNLGQHYQLHGSGAQQLRYFLAAYKLAAGDVQIMKKVIQSYYRLGKYAQARKVRKALLAALAASSNPRVSGMKELCFDQFPAGPDRFLVYETLKPTGSLQILIRFRLVRNGRVAKSINLETSDYAKQRGWPYLLGEHSAAGHRTFNVGWRKLPPYPVLKKAALAAHAGKLRQGASSSRR